MWLINLLPIWVFHAILLASILVLVASTVLKVIPFINTYLLPLQVCALLLIVAGVWFEGGIYNEAAWQDRVTKLAAQVAAAEQASRAANAVLDTQSKEKVRVIRAKQLIVKQYIDREVTKYNSTCVIPPAVVKAHNAAALNQEVK